MADQKDLLRREIQGLNQSIQSFIDNIQHYHHVLVQILDKRSPIYRFFRVQKQLNYLRSASWIWQREQTNGNLKALKHIYIFKKELNFDFALEIDQLEKNFAKDIVSTYVKNCLESWKNVIKSPIEDFSVILPESVNRLNGKQFINTLHYFATKMVIQFHFNINKFRIQQNKNILILRNKIPSTDGEYAIAAESVLGSWGKGTTETLDWHHFVTVLVILTNTICHLVQKMDILSLHERTITLITIVSRELAPYLATENLKDTLKKEVEKLNPYMTSEEIKILRKLSSCHSAAFKGILRPI